VFLADINNEVIRNETYIRNLLKLQNFVMVKFNNDTIVEPVETEWFGFYKPGQSSEVVTLQESDLYVQVSLLHGSGFGSQERNAQIIIHMFRTAELNHNLKTAMFEKVLEYL
jgi:hypothetical protein